MNRIIQNAGCFEPESSRTTWCQPVLELLTNVLIKDLAWLVEEYTAHDYKHPSTLLLYRPLFSLVDIQPCHSLHCANQGIWLFAPMACPQHCIQLQLLTAELMGVYGKKNNIRSVLTTWQIRSQPSQTKFVWEFLIRRSQSEFRRDFACRQHFLSLDAQYIRISQKFPIWKVDNQTALNYLGGFPHSTVIAKTLVQHYCAPPKQTQ